MERQNAPRHVLFDLSPIDIEEELEDKTKRCYQNFKRMINGKSSKERHETYSKYIATNPQLHIDELTMGILVAILVENEGQQEYYSDVVAFSKDSLNLFASHMNAIIIERISRLSQHSIKQIFWLTRQLIRANVAAVENTCSNLIRQTAKGDLSPRNLFMADSLIDLFCDTRGWLVNTSSFTGPTVIFNTMRLIIDHGGPAHKALRKKETDFVVGLIREKFDFVLPIGRDFLRLLHHLLRVPEFAALNQDIYVNNPKLLSPKYEGPHQLLSYRTPRRLFQSCLTFDMERKISFLATHVDFGNQRRYQDWFSKQFLSGTESTLLRCDLIRYICTIIHPSNEVLCSNIMPRWAIIGWLLTTSIHVVSSCRLALFLDWLAYDQSDNIMNIEPAILLMCHSARSHPQVTTCLLEFLCRAPTMFHPKISDQIRSGIKRSLQQILEKRVIQSLKPIFVNHKYDPTLRALIKENFPEYCQMDNGIAPVPELISPGVRTASGITTLPSPTSITAPVTAPVYPSQPTPPPKRVDLPIQQPEKRAQPEIIALDEDPNVIQQSDTKLKIVPLDSVPNNSGNNNHHDDSTREHQLSIEQVSPTPKPVAPNRTWAASDTDRAEPPNAESNPALSRTGAITNLSRNLNPVNDAGRIQNQSAASESRETMTTSEDENFRNLMQKKQQFMGMYYQRTESKMVEPHSGLPTQVQFPFMEVDRPFPFDALGSFDSSISGPLNTLTNTDLPDTQRCSIMTNLITAIKGLKEFDTQTIEVIGDCLASAFALDFTTRIYPSNGETDLQSSLKKPFFSLCKDAYSNEDDANNDDISLSMALLAYIGTVFKATGFLVIYYLKVESTSTPPTSPVNDYQKFYQLRSSPNDQKSPPKTWNGDKFAMRNHFEEDLRMMSEYDSEMFSYVLPTIFSEFTTKFDVTNNVRLIKLAMSAIGPSNLSDLVSYCMTGTTKIVHRDASVQRVIKESLSWPSWEQYLFWKIISAHTIPIDCYWPIFSSLDAKEHPEAITSLLLSMQKIYTPHGPIIESVIAAFSPGKEHYVASLLRHWALKTDVKELVKNIIMLIDQPPVKRKGQAKAPTKPLSAICVKTLSALELIRSKAPKNKIFAQPELFESLAQVEQLCDEVQKKKFSKLFEMQPKPTKKKKVEKDT